VKILKIDGLNEENKEFMNWVWVTLFQLTFKVRFCNFLLGTMNRFSTFTQNIAEKRRSFLFILGVSWVFSVGWQVLIVVLVFISSWYGLWSWVWSGSNQVVPPLWILTLGDTSFISLGILSVFSTLVGYSLGVSSLGLIFCSSALFVGVLSVQGALLIMFAERLGLWFHILTKVKAQTVILKDLWARVTIAIFFFFIQFIFGGLVIDLARLNLGFQYVNLWSRFFEFAYLYFWWAALETVLCLTGFHYYWKLSISKNEVSR